MSRLLAMAAVISVASVNANAQETPLETPQGRDEFLRANRFFEAAEYEAALPLYRDAYRLSGRRPSTIRGLAQCERALKHYDDAIVHFEEYLATHPEDAAEVHETVKLLREIRDAQSSGSTDPVGGPRAQPTPLVTSPPQPEPTSAPAVVAQVPPDPETPLLASPLFWVIAGVAVVGGVLAVSLSMSGDSEPSGGTTGVVLYR
ncbi:MAG: tetratricopeptide repeat protein [Deltaproteobacteria bacterium]|nr:tetratricopeptide repeat protein [Deltaproteobacteria bacterium]